MNHLKNVPLVIYLFRLTFPIWIILLIVAFKYSPSSILNIENAPPFICIHIYIIIYLEYNSYINNVIVIMTLIYTLLLF